MNYCRVQSTVILNAQFDANPTFNICQAIPKVSGLFCQVWYEGSPEPVTVRAKGAFEMNSMTGN